MRESRGVRVNLPLTSRLNDFLGFSQLPIKSLVKLNGFCCVINYWRFICMIKFESERHFEDFVIENFDFIAEQLGIDDNNWLFKRQVGLKGYGIADVVLYKNNYEDVNRYEKVRDYLKENHKDKYYSFNRGWIERFYKKSKVYPCKREVIVIELKNKSLVKDDLCQLARYVRSLKNAGLDLVSGILIGPSISVDDWVYLIDSIDNIDVFTFKINVDGVSFEEKSGWFNSGEDFTIEDIDEVFNG